MATEKLTPYLAVGRCEGFEPATRQQELEAWAYLVKTGQCWSLQGWFGRNASALIGAKIISEDGELLKSAEELEL